MQSRIVSHLRNPLDRLPRNINGNFLNLYTNRHFLKYYTNVGNYKHQPSFFKKTVSTPPPIVTMQLAPLFSRKSSTVVRTIPTVIF